MLLLGSLQEETHLNLLIISQSDVCVCVCVCWTDCVRSGELPGRTFFLKISIQFLRIPAVMAESVNMASLVCRRRKRERSEIR